MTSAPRLIAAAAAVMVVMIVGYPFVAGTAAPSPSPVLIARGTFVTSVGEVVELEATREGSSVTGHMTVSAQGQKGPYDFTVDLRCARTTADGLILIGGVTTDSKGNAQQESTWAGIVLQRGSPVGASTWSPGSESHAAGCLAFLDEQDSLERSTHLDGDRDWTAPVVGTVELGQ